MNPLRLQWTVIDNFQLEVHGKDCQIWIEPRPHYCDRGNYIAKIEPSGDLARDLDHSDGWPRYYFDLGIAQREVEAWLFKRGQAIES